MLIPIFGITQFIEKLEFGGNPGDLQMSIYLPKSNWKSTKKIPVVVALHGCSQNSKSMAKQTGWNELAEEFNFAVIYPEQRRRNNGSNCFNWFELDDITKDSGESKSIMNMLSFALSEFNLDENNVSIYGLSAGAVMSVSLMANYPDYFKSGAIFAGAPYKLATSKKEAFQAMTHEVNLSPQEWAEKLSLDTNSQIPKLIVFHGQKDKVVPIHYAYELIEQWTAIQNMKPIPFKTERNFNLNADITRITYVNDEEVEKIIFYEIKSTRHEIPIDKGSGEKQGGKKSVFSKDIDFFSSYWVVKEFGLIK